MHLDLLWQPRRICGPNLPTALMAGKNKLLTTIGWRQGGQTDYALEGSVFIAGAVVQWLRDGLGIIRTTPEIEELARSVPDSGDVYLVPAFSGLGAPRWDAYARGAIVGLTRGTTAAHIARAALEGIAFQVGDILSAMESDSGIRLAELRVDGGASKNNLLMQFQADLLGVPVVRAKNTETTALGAAYLSGLAVDFYKSKEELASQWASDQKFEPAIGDDQRASLRSRCIRRSNGRTLGQVKVPIVRSNAENISCLALPRGLRRELVLLAAVAFGEQIAAVRAPLDHRSRRQ